MLHYMAEQNIAKLLDKQTEVILDAVDVKIGRIDEHIDTLDKKIDLVDVRVAGIERQIEQMEIRFSQKLDKLTTTLDKFLKRMTDHPSHGAVFVFQKNFPTLQTTIL